MVDARHAAQVVLALPREKRLRTLDEILGRDLAYPPADVELAAVLARNAAVVTLLREACEARGIKPPWYDRDAIAGRS